MTYMRQAGRSWVTEVGGVVLVQLARQDWRVDSVGFLGELKERTRKNVGSRPLPWFRKIQNWGALQRRVMQGLCRSQ